MDLIDRIAVERRRTADLLLDLDDAELAAPSLCGAWSVRQVGQHLLMPLVTPLPVVLGSLARSRFDFHRANLRLTSRLDHLTAADLATGLREHARHAFKPPGHTHAAPLTDVVVHGQDMARPVGRRLEPDPDSVLLALDLVTSHRGAGLGGVSLAGLRLTATDASWTTGDGVAVEGRALDLLLAASGRATALDHLTGPGRDTLRSIISRRT